MPARTAISTPMSAMEAGPATAGGRPIICVRYFGDDSGVNALATIPSVSTDEGTDNNVPLNRLLVESLSYSITPCGEWPCLSLLKKQQNICAFLCIKTSRTHSAREA